MRFSFAIVYVGHHICRPGGVGAPLGCRFLFLFPIIAKLTIYCKQKFHAFCWGKGWKWAFPMLKDS